MTPAQFHALRQLMGWHKGAPIAGACALVLVEGLTQAEAARLMGTTRQGVNRAMARVQQVREAAAILTAQAPLESAPL